MLRHAAPRRQGFWFNLGAGYSTAAFNGDNCGRTTREDGFAGTAAIGGTLSPQQLLGVESDGWYKEEGGIKTTVGSLNAVAYIYPARTGGLLLSWLSLGGTIILHQPPPALTAPQ